ncbi:MAG: hypothetical protein H6Q89_1798 [Myxococcaceae bacterium]|nr:hypothetical protein [Myxococcaceae bacterium]
MDDRRNTAPVPSDYPVRTSVWALAGGGRRSDVPQSSGLLRHRRASLVRVGVEARPFKQCSRGRVPPGHPRAPRGSAGVAARWLFATGLGHPSAGGPRGSGVRNLIHTEEGTPPRAGPEGRAAGAAVDGRAAVVGPRLPTDSQQESVSGDAVGGRAAVERAEPGLPEPSRTPLAHRTRRPLNATAVVRPDPATAAEPTPDSPLPAPRRSPGNPRAPSGSADPESAPRAPGRTSAPRSAAASARS